MRNPIRRNKNIGKTQGGRVISGTASEKMTRSWSANNTYVKLSDEEGPVQLFCDNPSKNYYHPCEPNEYLKVLKMLPEELTQYVKAIILPRKSKSDQRRGVDAKRVADCIIINPFPKSMEEIRHSKPQDWIDRHDAHWCSSPFEQDGDVWVQRWQPEEVRRYYLFHLFLHELGHINQPWFNALSRREEFAENFALEWAIKLGALKNPRGKSRMFSPRKVGDVAGYDWKI